MSKKRMRGQSSLEAMLALAAYLAAIAVLIAAAQGLSKAFMSQMSDSASLLKLSHEALLVDLACGSPPHSSFNASISGAVLPDGESAILADRENSRIRAHLLCSASASQTGVVNAKNPIEPI
jgi:hypothetical protein